MRAPVAVALCFVVFAPISRADDLSALLRSCGAGATIETHPPSDYEDGLWHRTVEYKAGDSASDWMVVGFTSKSKYGPWTYQDSMFVRLPCLASSGIVRTSDQSRVQVPVTHAATHTGEGVGHGSRFLAFLLAALVIVGYIFPISVAMARGCKATAGIAVVNIFLGWTFVGWVVALAWAVSGEKAPRPVRPAS